MKTTRLFGMLGLAAVLGLGVQAQAGEVQVAVAANFANAARDLIPLFQKATGHTVKASFGSTGALYSQIENGAPFEVFLAADTKRAKMAEEAGLALPGTRFTYAKGRLVMWSAKPHLFEDGETYLKAAKFRRAAIANPKTAPYGLAAEQVMEHLGLWSALQDKLVRGESIAQTFQFVATGNTQVGFVALAQIKGWKGAAGSLWEIPESYYGPIAQQAVLLKKGEHDAAAHDLMAFLKSKEARAVIAGYGYGVE